MGRSGEEDDSKLFVNSMDDDMMDIGVAVDVVESKDGDWDKMQEIGRCFNKHDEALESMRRQHEEALSNLEGAWQEELKQNSDESKADENEAALRDLRHKQHMGQVDAYSAEELYKLQVKHLEKMERMYREIDPSFHLDSVEKGMADSCDKSV